MDYFDLYYLYLSKCEKSNWINLRDPNHDDMEWNHTLPQCIFKGHGPGQWLTMEQHAIASALQTLAFGHNCMCGMHKKHMPDWLWNLCVPYYSESIRKFQVTQAAKGEHPWQQEEHIKSTKERLKKLFESEQFRKEQSARISKRNSKLAKEGNHPMQKKENRVAASERAKDWTQKMIADGTHPSLKEGASERITQQNLERVQDGTHNLMGEEAAKRSSEKQLERVAQGTHQWKTEEHAAKVKERFTGAKHWVNQQGEGKFQGEKPEGEWQNGRKWRNPK
jgi:hypothetical protein